MKRTILMAIVAMVPFVSSPLETEAQEPPLRPSLRDQWAHSPHARSMDTEDERERMNTPGCARCHTAQGFHHETLDGLPSAAPYPEAEGITCRACHLDGEGRGVGPLRVEDPAETCRGCHDELVTNRPNDLSWCSQWGIFEGAGGIETPGRGYPSATHSELGAGCVSCHMAGAGDGADPLAVGSHTFRVRTKGVEPEIFNLGPCLECHAGMTVEDVNASQLEVRGLLQEVASLLPRKAVAGAPHQQEPRFPADESLTPTQARAAYNYWLVAKDGSFGVHNPAYTRALLQGTLVELREGRSDAAPQPFPDAHPIDHLIWAVPDLSEGKRIIGELAQELGLEAVGPSPGERRTPDGTLVRWSHVDFLGHDFGQFLPFAINWLDSVHPSKTAPEGPVLRRVVVEHPRADELRRLYQGLGIQALVVQAVEPRIVVDYDSPNGPFSLTSGQSLLAYYEARRVGNIR